MRWDNLFDDLAGQLERELSADEIDIGVEEERLRLSRLTVRDRLDALLRASDRTHRTIALDIRPREKLRVVLLALGRDWMSCELVDERARSRHCVIPLAAVAGVSLDAHQVAASLQRPVTDTGVPALADRLGLAFVLRDLARRRSALDVVQSSDIIHGTIDRVGRDHFDIAVHDRGEPRRNSAVSAHRLVPFAEVSWIVL